MYDETPWISSLEEAGAEINLNQWYYAPLAEIVERLVSMCRHHEYKTILEVGPGRTPFPIATHFVDHDVEHLPSCVRVDLNTEPLPFPDRYFDFVYCRHFREIRRVSNSFYIETPSPLIEMLRRIDAHQPFYRGYIHHRYLVWSEASTLYCLPKYPLIEYISIPPALEQKMIWIANHQPWHWNHYYFWSEAFDVEPSKCQVLTHDVHYTLGDQSYGECLGKSLIECIRNNHEVLSRVFSEDIFRTPSFATPSLSSSPAIVGWQETTNTVETDG